MALRPVKRIEVEHVNWKLRIVLVILAVVIAVAAFSYGINSILDRNSGWQAVEAYVDGVDCSSDFVLQYDFGSTGATATVEYKAVSALYTTALEEAYQAFYPSGGLAAINANPNTVVETDPVLYRALELIQSAGNRCLYLGPVYDEYDRIFLHENEVEAARYDPGQDEEIAAYVSQSAAYANDPSHINLELLSENRVRLNLSEEYLAYAKENGIEEFLDFGWMTNAFFVDHIAETLVENGYTMGHISSYDGFTRNLDKRDFSYSLNLFDRLDNTIHQPAVMNYTGPMSIVSLRNYPMTDADRWHYFSFANGRIATAFIDPEDGMSKSSTDNLVAYSESAGCTEILLEIAPIFLADELDEVALDNLSEQQMQIQTVWFEDTQLKCTQESLMLAATEDAETAGYKIPQK